MARGEAVAARDPRGARGLPAELAELAGRVQPTTLARDQRLPVLPPLETLLPRGLRRGATVAVDGRAATSLALAVAAGPSLDGAWVAAVGFGRMLGLEAAAGYGVVLERLVLVADPPPEAWAGVVAALVDAFEVVLVRTPDRVPLAAARRLTARVRERRGLLVQVGRSGHQPWPQAAEVALTVTESRWVGLGDGHGHLRARRVRVRSGGRRDAARPREADLWLPDPDGALDVAVPEPVPIVRDRRLGDADSSGAGR